MNYQKTVICVLLLACARTLNAQEAEFVPLFNGKDLTGWQRVNTDESTWSIKDEMLICSGKPTGELRTKRMYQNFILEVEWRHMRPRGNAGIFVWADDITAPGVPFHRSIEVQVLENAYGNTRGYTTHGDIFPIHGATMKPINGRGGSRAFPTESRSKPSPEWNHYRIECMDGNISLAVNGKVVTRGEQCSPRKGYICVESEGGLVHYRNMRIKELPSTKVEAEHIAIADRGYRCLYTGIDLNGWQVSGEWKPRDWRLTLDSEESSSLSTTVREQDVAFICDVKSAKSRPLTVSWKGTAIELETSKGWSRIEGREEGDELLLTANGQGLPSRPLSRGQATNEIKFSGAGPMELANIYVRGEAK